MLSRDLIERIRSIFLHETEHVTIEEAAAMLGRTEDDIHAAIARGEIETVTTCSGTRIDTRELAEQAVHVWPLVTIEEALGRDASMVMPRGLRSSKLTVLVRAECPCLICACPAAGWRSAASGLARACSSPLRRGG
jgi:hypothetical protein